ncbi:hypothetical protein F53441_6233 [Fusarium austroafricanum]|uniref:Complex 1 LYR protein domain-containing protein n=1 Tax=Fusarium austroafricanum TaxID=2364996 RepID=A0A8H4P7B4_9HYPO|nr:hypothetical protein F53441_6233 [Fusarium austroafricanum]
MIRQHFVAAHNSRHRVAALALYRALLKTGSKVPLPHHLHPDGQRHPIVKILRKRFAKNKPLTSFRLIYGSMTAGYKFLTLFTKGRDAKSLEHSEILQHLQKRNERRNQSIVNAPSFKKPPRSKQLYHPPLLTKVSAPGEPMKYEPTIRPLPKTAFVGDRKVPVPGNTAEFLTFLKIKKPQPAVFSRSVGLKMRNYRRSVVRYLDVENEDIPEAQSEDHWDMLMDKLMRKEGVATDISRDEPTASHHFTTLLTKAWWEQKLARTADDWQARSRAVVKILEQERTLVEEEKKSGAKSTDPQVAKETLNKILSDYRQKQADLEQKKKAEGGTSFEDPFMSSKWVTKARDLERQHVAIHGGRGKRRGKDRASWPRKRELGNTGNLETSGSVDDDFFKQIAGKVRSHH